MPRFYCLIDEEVTPGKEYAKLLTTKSLKVIYIEPSPDLDFIRNILDNGDLVGVLLDYKLSYSNSTIPYDAPALAGHIRGINSKIPVVALSGILIKDDTVKSAYERTKRLFDWRLDKSEVSESSEPAKRQIKSLADGYDQLNKVLSDHRRSLDKALMSLLKLDDDPEGLSSWLATESKGEPYLAAQSIVHGLLRWSGPLLPLKYAAAYLGLDPDSSHKIQKLIKSSIYLGPFHDLYDEPRYWASKLASCGPIKGVAPAVCKASGKKANTICDACGDPFDSFYTVGVKRANTNFPVENGRVCGICLNNELEGLTIRAESRMLVKNVIAETQTALKKNKNDPKS